LVGAKTDLLPTASSARSACPSLVLLTAVTRVRKSVRLA
jgi:hypothetical protein